MSKENYFSFQRGSFLDVVQPVVLAVIASGFSLVIFKRVKV